MVFEALFGEWSIEWRNGTSRCGCAVADRLRGLATGALILRQAKGVNFMALLVLPTVAAAMAEVVSKECVYVYSSVLSWKDRKSRRWDHDV
jgi:hypothetical protein